MIARFIRILPGLGRQVPPLFTVRVTRLNETKQELGRTGIRLWVAHQNGQRMLLAAIKYAAPTQPVYKQTNKELRSGCTKAAKLVP